MAAVLVLLQVSYECSGGGGVTLMSPTFPIRVDVGVNSSMKPSSVDFKFVDR